MTAFEKEHEELIETMTNAKRDAVEGNGQGQGGGKEHEGLFDSDPESLKDFESDDATAQRTKRKRAQAEADARAKKRRKGEAPDFRLMQETDLLLWVKELPSDLRKPLLDDIGEELQSTKAHYARVQLERIYKKTFQTWAAENPLNDASVKEIRLWRSLGTFDQRKKYAIKNTQGLKNFCEEQLFPQTRLIDTGGKMKSVELPDYSNDKEKWPEEWK